MTLLRVARLTGAVDEESVAATREQLYALSERYPGESITLDINSPGGSVPDGMELFGIVRELSNSGHSMITRISGQACSMGGIIAQAGDVRQIREGSYLHLHEASWGSVGKAHKMREDAEHVEKITRDIAKIYSRRANMSVDEIYDRMHRHEWWLDADEALAIGFVDEIV